MLWYIFIIFSLISAFFFVLGYSNRTKLWVQIGALFLIFIGIMVISGGLDLPSGYTIGAILI